MSDNNNIDASSVSKNQQANGKCLCGSIEINAVSMNPDVGACHCGT